MSGDGKQIFCVIESGPLEGVGEGRLPAESLHTIPYQDLAAVVRDTVLPFPPPTREDLVGHLRVIEQIMARQAVVPVGFGAVAASEEEVRDGLLVPRYHELKGLLHYLRGKVELGLKVLWREMDSVFAEIVAESQEISALRAWIAARPAANTHHQRVRIGQLVAQALEEKRTRQADAMMAALAPLAVQARLGKLFGDKMILNAAFLVEREREAEFDAGVARFGRECGDGLLIRYVGPAPPFNFVESSGIVSESSETLVQASH